MGEDRSCKTCDSATCSARAPRKGESRDQFLERQALTQRLCQIEHKILVLSGKGGVGKSTVATHLAVSLAARGLRTGLLDIDLHGPSIPKLLGIEGQALGSDGRAMEPAAVGDHLKVVSIGFLLRSPDEAVIWRGPLKMGVIKQFLKDVNWGALDYLIVDSPPGTGDEPLSICQLIDDADGAVIVTTPQDLAIADVRKCITFCGQLGMPVLGVIENMSGFVCPHCGQRTDLFKSGGGQAMAAEMAVPFLGRVPLDTGVVSSGDAGQPLSASAEPTAAGRAFDGIVARLVREPLPEKECVTVKIAVPVAGGQLCQHFGHCQEFAVITVENGTIRRSELLEPPPHEPGALPRWLHEQGVSVVIAGGMGRRAQAFFEEFGIEVVVGAQPGEPQRVAQAYVEGALETGANVCDH